MALGKTVSYTPFQETSFGYGSSEIATAHSTEFPNATDIVKVVITHTSGNWDDTGHISTPSSGTAVAVYHKSQQKWECSGERDDVDAVLDTLSFYPADYEASRTWTPTAMKANQTTGTFADEEPPAIGDTVFSLKVYDGASVVSSNVVTFDPTEPSFGNQRPFFSVVPPTEDLNTTAHDSVAGGVVDFGTISHGTDTENVRVKCEFRPYGSTNTFTGSGYGVFSVDTDVFVGSKKPATPNTSDARFDFTGSVAEAQAFLDNVQYHNAGNQTTFDMYLTITDGIVGAEYTKTVYFSDATIGVTTIPDVHYVEDANPAYWDFGNLTFSNVQPDVTQYQAVMTLDSTGTSGTSNFLVNTPVDSQSYSSGVLTVTDADLDRLKTALRNVNYVPNPDFNDSFNFTVDFTFSNPTLGTTYSATQQTVAVTGQEVAEISNPTTSHTYAEDQTYDFDTGDYPQIIHGYNHDFDVVFTLSDTSAGTLGRHGTQGFFRAITGGYKLSGNKTVVNQALDNLFFAPSLDYNSDFTINFTVDRTSGDLTFETQDTGSFTMTSTDSPEFTSTAPVYTWSNNESVKFDSGLRITDTAADFGELPAAGTTYTVEARLRNFQGQSFTDGKIISTKLDILSSNTGLGNTYSMTGSRVALNENLESMKFVPDPFYAGTDDFYVEYKITRNFDGTVFTNFSPAYRTTFGNPTINPTFTLTTQTFDWNEDEVFDFDSNLRIREMVTENKMYTAANGYTEYFNSNHRVTIRAKYYDGSTGQALGNLTWSTTSSGSATTSGTGTVADPLIITGLKADVNTALSNLRFTPNTPDFDNSPASAGNFWIEARIERLADTTDLMLFTPQVSNFNAATNQPEYLESWTNLEYTEDIQDQRVFSGITAIVDGAGDLFDATYTAKIGLSSVLDGEFDDYVESSYVAADYFSNFEVHFSGSKSSVNNLIQDVKFTPVVDGTNSIGIVYSQTRTFDGTTVSHANAASVGTMTGVATPEFVYGTANSNIQYFVPEAYLNGVDTTQSLTNILSGNAYVTLTPKQISTNQGKQYVRPITITDTAESGGPSQYKIVFSGGTLFNLTGVSLNTMDTGYLSKTDLHALLDDGIYVTGISAANNNLPTRAYPGNKAQDGTYDPYPFAQYTANFTLHRRTYDGTEAQIGQGSLTYEARSGLALYLNPYLSSSFSDITNATTTQVDTEFYVDYLSQTDQLVVTEDWVSGSSLLDNSFGIDITARFLDTGATSFSLFQEGETGRHTGLGNDFYIDQQSGRGLVGSVASLDATGRWFRAREEFNTAPATKDVQLWAWTEWGVLMKSGTLTLTSDINP